MKILQILPELNVGGVETGTVDFAKYLVEKGHESIVVSNGGKLVQALEKNGSKHYTLQVHKKSLFTILGLVKELRRIINTEKVDIVHARSRVPAWIAYFACRKTNASFITTCHGYYKSRFFSQVMGFSKLIIVPSLSIGRHMIEDFRVSAKSIRCIPRSVDLDRFNVEKEKKAGKASVTIAIVGRLTPLKGHTYFLRSMVRIVRSIPYAKIWIIGDTPVKKEAYKGELEALVLKLGIKDNVEFLGSRQDIPELLSKVDVLVMSSIEPESFGRVILEAQAIGVPVVATKVGGVVDIIDHEKTGLLVMAKDIDGMSSAVLRILKDRRLSSEIVKNAKEKLKNNFTLDHMASKTLEVYEELLSSMNILVIKISSVGDVVLIVPSLKELRKNFPKAKIYCLVGEESRKVLQNCPYIDGIIVCDLKKKHGGILKIFGLSRKLRRYRFDKIIDFQNSRKSHLLAFLGFARQSYGFDNGKWSFLITNRLKKYDNNVAAVPHQFQLLKSLGIESTQHPSLELWPTTKDKQYVRSLLDSEWLGNAKNIIGINISASEKWVTKNWPVEHIAKLCDFLSHRNLRVIITGMEKDRVLSDRLLSMTRSKPAIFIGKTDVMQLALLIKACKVYLTPDSAPMHIAAAMNVPSIALFGPTDSQRHVPPAKNMVVIDKKLTCSPCYNSYCKILTHACMNDIQPEEVLKTIERFLAN